MLETVTIPITLEGDSQVVRLPEAFRLPGSEVTVRRSERGVVIEPVDVLIAAQARCRGATLVTANTRELVRVAGLALEDWTI